MKGRFTALAMAGAFAASVFATAAMAAPGGSTGNGAISGPHYNLNIIGVENEKKAKLTKSYRHTIFVPLKSTGSGKYSKKQFTRDGSEEVSTEIVDSIIWLTPGWNFRVCDGNGFDAAYDGCDSGFDETFDAGDTFFNSAGEPLGPLVGNERKMGAVFMLPCNENITNSEDDFIGCDAGAEGHIESYGVWARAVGNSGEATITTCAFETGGDLVCSLDNEVLTSVKGKSEFKDVTDALTSLVVSECVGDIIEGVCTDVETTRIALFAGETKDWFWNYDNNYLRLAQLRFYLQ